MVLGERQLVNIASIRRTSWSEFLRVRQAGTSDRLLVRVEPTPPQRDHWPRSAQTPLDQEMSTPLAINFHFHRHFKITERSQPVMLHVALATSMRSLSASGPEPIHYRPFKGTALFKHVSMLILLALRHSIRHVRMI